MRRVILRSSSVNVAFLVGSGTRPMKRHALAVLLTEGGPVVPESLERLAGLVEACLARDNLGRLRALACDAQEISRVSAGIVEDPRVASLEGARFQAAQGHMTDRGSQELHLVWVVVQLGQAGRSAGQSAGHVGAEPIEVTRRLRD